MINMPHITQGIQQLGDQTLQHDFTSQNKQKCQYSIVIISLTFPSDYLCVFFTKTFLFSRVRYKLKSLHTC